MLKCSLVEILLLLSAAQLLTALTDLSDVAQEWCVIAAQGQNQARQLTGVSKNSLLVMGILLHCRPVVNQRSSL